MTHIMKRKRQPTQLTLRGIDAATLRAIHELAARERISVNKAALRLLEKGAGVAPRVQDARIGSSLDHLIGTWTEKEATSFLSSIESCGQIDPDLWK